MREICKVDFKDCAFQIHIPESENLNLYPTLLASICVLNPYFSRSINSTAITSQSCQVVHNFWCEIAKNNNRDPRN